MTKFLWKYINIVKIRFIILLICNIFRDLNIILLPFITGILLDNIVYDKGSKMETIICLYAIAFLFQICLSIIKQKNYMLIYLKTTFSIMNDVYRFLEEVDYILIEELDKAKISQQINSDSGEFVSLFMDFLLRGSKSFISLIVILYIILTANKMIFSFYIISIFLYIVIYFGFKNKLYSLQYKLKERQVTFFSIYFNIIKRIKMIKIHVLKEYQTKKLVESELNLSKDYTAHQNLSILYNFLHISLVHVTRMLVFIFSSHLLLIHEISMGTFTLLNNYINSFLIIINDIILLSQNIPKMRVSYNRLIKYYNMTKENSGAIEINTEQIEKITITNLSFKYKNKVILDKINYTFNKGYIYCICGKNGAGKSTLFYLILGLYRLKFEGDIFFNDININNLNIEFLRKKIISFYSQKPEYLIDTIINNVEAFVEDMKEYEKTKNRFNLNLNELLILRENAENISGGELSKLAIIRVFLKNTPVLMFDEPTNHLDSQTINELCSVLKEIKKEHITLIITHDEAIKKIADIVLNI